MEREHFTLCSISLYALFICNDIIIFLCYPDPGTDVIISRPITVRSDADNYIQY